MVALTSRKTTKDEDTRQGFRFAVQSNLYFLAKEVLGYRDMTDAFHLPMLLWSQNDPAKKKHVGAWVDNMGTGFMVSTGKCAVGAKTCTMTGTMNDPLTGKPCKVREVLTHNGDNSMTFDMYGPDPSGKEFHMMQILYTR